MFNKNVNCTQYPIILPTVTQPYRYIDPSIIVNMTVQHFLSCFLLERTFLHRLDLGIYNCAKRLDELNAPR